MRVGVLTANISYSRLHVVERWFWVRLLGHMAAISSRAIQSRPTYGHQHQDERKNIGLRTVRMNRIRWETLLFAGSFVRLK